MRVAVVGASGMVGGNLVNQLRAGGHQVDEYTRHNIHTLVNFRYDRMYVAAISSRKWFANENGLEDQKSIRDLLDTLKTSGARENILISTVDVYDPPIGDETINIKNISHEYGRNRLWAEDNFFKLFSNAYIVRLQGLVAYNLKKNILYDLKHKNYLSHINVSSSYQFYPLCRLANDIDICINRNLKIINLSCEPIKVSEIINHSAFKYLHEDKDFSSKPGKEIHYNVKSIYASLFNGENGYCVTKKESFSAIWDYLFRKNQMVVK